MGEVVINSGDNLPGVGCRVIVVSLVKSEGRNGTMDTGSGGYDREDDRPRFFRVRDIVLSELSGFRKITTLDRLDQNEPSLSIPLRVRLKKSLDSELKLT
jgi:hypothetical protein